MKRTLRKNITDLPYGLHDMHVTELDIKGNELIFKFARGFETNVVDGARINGEISFHNVDWDFCYVYVLDICKNEGVFIGRKQFLTDFVAENRKLNFEIIDEDYGYNSSKFDGYLYIGSEIKECRIDVYHLGAMEYITEE